MSDVIRIHSFAPAQPRRAAPVARWNAKTLWGAFARMLEVAATRRQLAEADDRTLQDLGISRAQARFEAARAPWHVDGRLG